MKDWSDLEEKYQDMRMADPKQAQTFKQRMTARFQVSGNALNWYSFMQYTCVWGCMHGRTHHLFRSICSCSGHMACQSTRTLSLPALFFKSSFFFVLFFGNVMHDTWQSPA